MKKIGLVFVLSVLLIGVGVFFVSCKTDLKTYVMNNLSDVRYCIFVGQGEGVTANLTCGLRENPYQYDGVSNKKIEFGVISVSLKTKPTEDVKYSITAGEKTMSGILEENPYNHFYMIDIEKIVDVAENVVLTLDGIIENMQLLPISKDWQIQYEDALDVGINALESDLNNLISNNKFCGECYLKIVLDQQNIDNPYYWCFVMCGQNGENKSVIIDVNTGEILTQTQS